jgi:acyl-CoA synthetase (NDP forming)
MSSALDLHPLIEARSIAVLGASADPQKVGGRPIAYLQRMGFSGRIVPINPNRTEIGGLVCAPSILETDPVDLAIISAPIDGKLDLVRDAIAAKAKAIVLFSAGFGEVGEQGRALQAELSDMARDAGVLVLGPNCLGAISVPNRLAATFTTALETRLPRAGSFSYVGQSGALGAYWLDLVAQTNLGVARWFSTGNEALISLGDVLAYLVEDPETKVIGAYVEDIKAPKLFREAAQKARDAGKTILAIKAGRSSAGARAVTCHTGANPGDDAAYAEMLADAGVVRVRSLTEMIDAARLLLAPTPPRGVRLGCATVSGGAGVLLCDAAIEAGLEIAELSPATTARLRAALPSFAHALNPVDVTGAVVSNPVLMPEVMSTLAAAPEIDTIVLFLGAMSSIADNLVSSIVRARTENPDKPMCVIWMGGPEAACAQIEAAGVPVFNEIPPAIAALACVARRR